MSFMKLIASYSFLTKSLQGHKLWGFFDEDYNKDWMICSCEGLISAFDVFSSSLGHQSSHSTSSSIFYHLVLQRGIGYEIHSSLAFHFKVS